MRAPETLLTQIAEGNIPCCLEEFCKETAAYDSTHWRRHENYEAYIRCLGMYILQFLADTLEDTVRKDKDHPLCVRLRAQFKDTGTSVQTKGAMDRIRTVVQKHGFHLCTTLIDEVDKKIHANLYEIMEAFLSLAYENR